MRTVHITIKVPNYMKIEDLKALINKLGIEVVDAEMGATDIDVAFEDDDEPQSRDLSS